MIRRRVVTFQLEPERHEQFLRRWSLTTGIISCSARTKSICSLRSHHAIPVYCEGERQARDEMSVSEACDVLGVTSTTVLRLIRLKQVDRSPHPSIGIFLDAIIRPFDVPMATRRTKAPRCAFWNSAACARSRNVATSISLMVSASISSAPDATPKDLSSPEGLTRAAVRALPRTSAHGMLLCRCFRGRGMPGASGPFA